MVPVKREKPGLGVFENGVLRKVFGPKVEKVLVLLVNLHFEQLHDSYYSTNIVRIVNSNTVRWAGYVARKGEQ